MIKKKIRRGGDDDDDDDNGFAAWGGYMAAKKAKLEDQFSVQVEKEEERMSDIFKGIAIFVNGYTVPTANELKRIMMVHGGVYHHYESHRTTHIIASNLPDCKVKQLKTLNVVKPSWIVESVVAGCLLDYKKYLLYSNQSRSQPRLNFPQCDVGSAASSNDSTSLPYVQTNEDYTFADKSESSVRSSHSNVHQQNGNVLNTSELCGVESGDSEDKAAVSATKKTSAGGVNFDKDDLVNHTGTSPSKGRTFTASKRTAVEPQFLSEFYGNSRLHHLSTMGAMFKEYVTRLREGSRGGFSGVQRLTDWKKANINRQDVRGDEEFVDDLMDDSFASIETTKKGGGLRTIMHIDMDCFFVSVGLRDRPELRGLPVAVTHAKGNAARGREGANRQYERDFYKQRFQNRIKQKHNNENVDVDEIERKSRLDEVDENDSLSEIASCNYEARKAGVKNGMFFGSAIKLCSNLKTIPYDFEGYKEVSFKLYDILASYTLDIEAVSCDEMYVDCTEVLKKANVSALEFATFLRQEIKDATDCTASAGFGSNPLQARLATKKAKPNGQFHLQPSDVELFMHIIKVEDLPGVGHSLAYRLQAEGITTCRDLQRLSLSSLQKKFGVKTGEALHRHARGEDNRTLDVEHQRKSVSAEVNYGIRFSTQKEAETFLCQLAEEVVSRMKQVRVRGRQVTLKLMVRAKDAPVETAKFMGHGACDNISRSSTLGAATDDANIIYREAVTLERQLKIPPCDLRGIGVQMSRLVNYNAHAASKNTLLTNFLRLGKHSERSNKVPEEQNVAHHQSKGREKEQDKKSLECTSTSTDSGGLCISKKVIVSTEKSTTGKKCVEHIANVNPLPERKLNKNGNLSKAKYFSQNKITNAKSSSTHCGPVPVTNTDKSLPMLTTPIEVPMMTLAQARKLIRAWVMSEVNPLNCDVVMFASYVQRLVLAHRLEDVDILYSLLYRLLINKGKPWKVAYQNIVKNTQTVMQAVYGANLKVPEFDE